MKLTNKTSLVCCPILAVTACALSLQGFAARAAIQVAVTQGEEAALAATYSSSDLIQGLIATELPGDRGWHPVNTDPADRLPAFTDGAGLRSTGLTGLLNDFPPAGEPTKRIEYALPKPSDIGEVRVFTGNGGRDGRVFQTYTISFSSDGGQTFGAPIYVQSHPPGTLNNQSHNSWRAVLSQVRDEAGLLASSATHIRFDFYGVDNSQGQYRDPFDGVNAFTGTDDGLNAPNTSPLVWEIDVLGPAAAAPSITAGLSGNNLSLTWVSEPGYVVQSTGILGASWADMDPQPIVTTNGNTNTAAIAIVSGNQYFRLRK